MFILRSNGRLIPGTQNGCNKFVKLLNALRVDELTTENFSDLIRNVCTEAIRASSMKQALRMYPIKSRNTMKPFLIIYTHVCGTSPGLT